MADPNQSTHAELRQYHVDNKHEASESKIVRRFVANMRRQKHNTHMKYILPSKCSELVWMVCLYSDLCSPSLSMIVVIGTFPCTRVLSWVAFE